MKFAEYTEARWTKKTILSKKAAEAGFSLSNTSQKRGAEDHYLRRPVWSQSAGERSAGHLLIQQSREIGLKARIFDVIPYLFSSSVLTVAWRRQTVTPIITMYAFGRGKCRPSGRNEAHCRLATLGRMRTGGFQ
ncbi:MULTISPECIES: hypothetical protein [unclassified Mesorhizobium]|uniref:hypothetical protein n=1 Tax=unclassified Mesorhizobium TaxID=325217 RepID=UPI0012EB0816|nr:hypothetical protein [Mesorhizobium sp. LNJC391B00]